MEEKAKMAKQVILWAFLAEKLLTVKTLGEILRDSGLGNSVDPLTEQEIVSSCAGLVHTESPTVRARYLDEELEAAAAESLDKVVVLSHASVNSYLSTKRKSSFPFADEQFVARCVSNSTSSDILSAMPMLHSVILW